MPELLSYFEHAYIRGRRRPGRGEHYGPVIFPIETWNHFETASEGVSRTTNAVEVAGVVWTVRDESSFASSDSSDAKTEQAIERTRNRREETGSKIMTQEERIEFLAAHNNFRNDTSFFIRHPQPTAAGMMKMYWSAALEASAVSWSMKCHLDLRHGNTGVVKLPEFLSYMSQYGTRIGQNLYFKGKETTPSSIVENFANETLYFTFSKKKDVDFGVCITGRLCNQYTQVVWQTSFLVGCGYALCEDTYVGTCYYMPGGNNGSSAPYKTGTACSLCPSDSTYKFTECEGQLCVPKDRCSPVKECTVVDTENCLCSESSYHEIVSRLLKSSGSIHVGPPVVVFGLLLPLVAILIGHGVLSGFAPALP